MSETDRYLSVLVHLRVLDEWLQARDVNEIAVNAPGVVQLWRGGVWEAVEAPEVSFDYLQTLGSFLANISRKPFDEAHPVLSAHLPGGERVEMTMPPTAARGMIYLNLRKHTSQPFALGQFAGQGYFTQTRHVFAPALGEEERVRLGTVLEPMQRERWALACAGDWPAFLAHAVRGRENILVSGATGSGKTSFIRALIELIPHWERILTVEDTPEMPLHNHPNSQALFYRRESQGGERMVGASAKEVLQAVMRKTPHRVMLAELRGDETFYYVQNVLNSGHPGGITTVHANSPREAFLRVALLIKASDEGRSLSLEDILRLLHMLVHVVVQIVFDPASGRHVPAVYYDPMHAMASLR
ncbi:type IV secretion system protein VirB11 [Variovorax sp. OK605]|jgi:type IV secretion system protein VirB11|uniref:P-type DNA transfer ATPase VirB11 n=1 Tax=Variovorax sp. OK605 TaxID=1855317 RepID=UPI0008E023AC|nr:P-type DNA transfer ATPase VirB11 [Variovorax sp. OK605]SFQ70394.1 type IV secretion system protein VirB11 [Variovorax sp. OK605]